MSSDTKFPELVTIKQSFARPRVDAVSATIGRELDSLRFAKLIRAGERVAITAGSRGIANIATMIRAVVDWVRAHKGEPFIIPAMGSHGGATAEGQLNVLAGFGISEDSMGCPIRSSMETEVVCHAPQGIPIHCDRNACSADHVILINRIKPHTGIAGNFESGLTKILLIGLGKQSGASNFHRAMHEFEFEDLVRAVVPEVVRKVRIAGCIAIVENAYDDTGLIQAVEPDSILEIEPNLLAQAHSWMARLPFDDIDLLLIDQIGKNISGTGMDTNVVGRKRNDHVALGDERPRIQRIAVRSLTPQTKGNAIGIGIAEFCHRRVVEAIDRQSTYVNCLTALHPTGAMLPMTFPSDRAMIEAALSTIGLRDSVDARLVWIRDTLNLETIRCSQNLIPTIPMNVKYEISQTGCPLQFDSADDLVSVDF